MLSHAARADVVVIGAGHSGLAMSHELGRRGIDHAVLERGEVANAWRTERWDSLRLLTPNWMCRLPGHSYAGDDPDGYMSAGEVVDFVSGYAQRLSAPVLTHTPVTRVAPHDGGYRVTTPRGDWWCRAVVLASGAFNQPALPGVAAAVPSGVAQLSAPSYRNPQQLDVGGVLVVGGSATGVQLAQEIQRSGRQVTLAVGEHVRMPRIYRGRDIQHWMLAAGLLDQRIEEADDPARARRVPSPQLAGTPERATIDLNALRAEGVEVVGRLAGIRDGKAQFSGSLRNVCALADLKMNRLLDAIDEWIAGHTMAGEVGPVERYAPTDVGASPRLGFELGEHVRTVVWATGLRPDYSWLDVPVFDRKGTLKHDRGVVDAPGLYVLGLPFLRRRKSSFMHGAEDDVRELGVHLAAHLERTAPVQATVAAA
ncbi:MAG TPA: NAD(P)-binding domain-containing protein [Burkholderiaceae bacterium]|nr:NAD(P)-binding domain-containing protein [Burkholderiaceae bacterium]